MQPHDAVAEAAEDDVAAVAGHRRADAGVEQFLDLVHDLGVGGVEIVLADASPGASIQHGQAGDEVLHDGAEHLRPQASASRRRRPWSR